MDVNPEKASLTSALADSQTAADAIEASVADINTQAVTPPAV